MSPAVGAALALGSAYAAIGAAVAVVATATRTLHLAVGQVLVAGVFAHLLLSAVGLPTWLALLAAITVGAALSALLGPLVVERLPEGLPTLIGMVVAAGVLDAVLARGVTARPVAARPLLDLPGIAGTDPAVTTALVLGLPTVGVLVVLLRTTRWGRALRLVGGSPPAAVAIGVDPAVTRTAAMAVGGAVAVLAGLLAAPLVTVGTPQAAGLTVRAVAAAALLGRGEPGAAVAGGLLLGAVEIAGGSLWPAAGAEVAVTVAIMLILAVRGGTHLRNWGRAW